MLKNYLILALRHFRKNLFYSVANVASLCIGITAALVIYLVVQFEYSFNKQVPHGDKVYRVVADFTYPDRVSHSSGVPPALTYRMKHEVQGVQQYAAFYQFYKPDVSIQTATAPVVFKAQPDIVFTDDHYFSLFPTKVIAGSVTSFKEPFTVVLDETRARQYFPALQPADIIGKQISYNDTITVTVAGIVQQTPVNSDLTTREFVSTATLLKTRLTGIDDDDWYNYLAQLYIRTGDKTTAATITRQLQALADANIEYKKREVTFHLQPLANLHFNADYAVYSGHTANAKTLSGLTLIAVFLLLLGCINFINLSTAQSVRRAKEIGVRKTMGGSRFSLISQFLMEAFLVTTAATMLAVVITPVMLQVFHDFLPENLTFRPLQQWHVIAFLVALCIVVSLVAGYYPAQVLSRFQPVEVLKNQVRVAGSSGSVLLRKGLIIGQFVIAQFFITATVIVGMQIRYTMRHDLQQRKDGIVMLKIPFKYRQQRPYLLGKIQAMPGVQQAGLSDGPPVTPWPSQSQYSFVGDKNQTMFGSVTRNADSNYLSVYQLQLVAGKNFTPASDSLHEILISQKLAKELGYVNPQSIIGQSLKSGNLTRPIIGVVSDFYTQSLHTALQPVVIEQYARNQWVFNIALQPAADWKQTLSALEKEWNRTLPGETFTPEFYDEQIAMLYKEEQHTATLLRWATVLMVIISCLGLLGLSLYTIYQRTKEIGIRKVMGATIPGIVQLVTSEFMKLVVLAIVIAVPLVWWAGSNWLQNYAYRITLSWWLFPVTGMIAVGIAWLAVSFQAVKAAMANPVKALRSE